MRQNKVTVAKKHLMGLLILYISVAMGIVEASGRVDSHTKMLCTGLILLRGHGWPLPAMLVPASAKTRVLAVGQKCIEDKERDKSPACGSYSTDWQILFQKKIVLDGDKVVDKKI